MTATSSRMASPANSLPRSTDILPSAMIAASARYAAAQPGRATYSIPTGWTSRPSTAAVHFFGLRYMAVDSILEWIVLDLVPLQYHAGKVLPLLVRNPYGVDVFPGTIRSRTVMHHPEKKDEHGRPLVHLTMNQNAHRAGLPEYVAEQLEVLVAGTMPIDRNVQVADSRPSDEHAFVGNGTRGRGRSEVDDKVIAFVPQAAK